MKRTNILLFAALIGTVIMGAFSGNSQESVVEPETTAMVTSETNEK